MKRPVTKSRGASTASSEPVAQQPGALPLHQIQKMQVFGSLVGGVAHDFNNLLSIFQGYTEILQMEMDAESPLQEHLNEMLGAVERAKTLTSQLLNFSRATASAPKPILLRTVLVEFHKMLRRLIGENIELVLELEEECGWVMADPRQIESLMTNLVVNACEAMPQVGRLCIALENAVIKSGKDGLEPGDYVRLAVSDTGIGMENDLVRQIFEPGFTTKTPGRNIGLGLFLCAEIAQQNSAKILVESTPGKGSTFSVFFPRLSSPSQATPKPLEKKDFAAIKAEILIVEDDAPTRKSFLTLVRRLGIEARCASNGDEALRILEANPKIRLVIADIVMPLLGGIEMATIMRKRWPGTKLILTSGYSSEPPSEAVAEHAVFLPKPIPPGVLIQNIRNLLDA
jgi:two-component system, cell cycle sensor histidine kinase and response regulator CckA